MDLHNVLTDIKFIEMHLEIKKILKYCVKLPPISFRYSCLSV